MVFDLKQYQNHFLYDNLIYSDSNAPINPLLIKEKLLCPFLKLYYDKELGARRIVKRLKKEAFTDTQYTEIVNRLDDGISMINLKKKISTFINNSTDTNLILSSFLDNAIDSGLIVPITIHRGEYLYRGFRHGEEIVWGVTNDKLLATFYKQFLGDEKSLSKFWFEKLLVLFLKLGLKEKDFLEEYNLSTPPTQKINLIGIRSFIFGEVSVSYDIEPNQEVKYNPILEDEAYWTSNRFIDLGVLTVNEKKNYDFDFEKLFYQKYESNKENGEVEDLDPSIRNKAIDIAELLKLCKDNKWLDAAGLVKITSCLTLNDNIASIGAELNIFNKNINSYVNIIRGGESNLTTTFLESLRDKSANYLWTAINSGRKKYLDFKKEEGVNLVNEITQQLSTINGFASRRWEEYWRKDIELSKNDEGELSYVNDRMGIILMDINSTIIYIHIILYELMRQQSKFNEFKVEENQKIQNYKNEIQTKKTQLDTLKNKSDTINFDNAELIQQLEKEIREAESEIRKISNKISYWDNYISDNKERIKSNTRELSKQNSAKLRSQNLVSEILSDSYKDSSEQELWQKIKSANNILFELKKDSKDSLEEFLLIVPQFGKIQKKVKYNSIIHLNCLSTDRSERNTLSTIIKRELCNFELEEYGEPKNDKSIVLLRRNEANKGDIIGGKGQFHYERLLKLSCKILQICIDKKLKIIISLIPYDDGIKAYYNPQTNNYDIVKENLFDILPENYNENQILLYNINENRKISLNQDVLVKNFSSNFEIETITSDSMYTVKIKKGTTEIEKQETKKEGVTNNYFYAPVTKSQFGNQNTMYNNAKEQQLANALTKQGVTEPQVAELIDILKTEEQDTTNRTLGTKVTNWCNNIKTIGLNVLSNIIFTAYYGLPPFA